MKTHSIPFRYIFLSSRLDQLWMPAAFWALFALLAWIFRGEEKGYQMAISFLGFVLPLMGGILSAYAILDDPALELHFATPRTAWLSILERQGLVLGILTVGALSYQVYIALIGIDLSELGSLAYRQLAWLVPSLGLMALGCAGAFALAQTTSGALLVGMVWIVELIARSWFASDPVARFFFVFMGAYTPHSPALPANQVFLLGIIALLLFASDKAFKKQERYI
jgi:hypothetical protein